jgi:transposase-like protein
VNVADQDRERWVKLVADFESSDLSQREFASERGISFSNLRYWLYRLRREARPLTAEQPDNQAEQVPARRRLTLTPVRVVASTAKPRTWGNEGNLRIRFPAGTDLAYLRALAAAL